MRAESGGGGDDPVFEPPQGSPSAIRAAAERLNGAATRVGDLGSEIRHHRIDEDAWSDSRAADAYTRRTDTVEDLSGHIETPLTRMSQALESYADLLDSTQRTVIEAKERYERETAASVEPITTVNANPHRTEAQVKGAEAESAKHAAAAEAARDDAAAAQEAYAAETAAIAQTIAGVAAELAHGTRLESLAKETVEVSEADFAEGGEAEEEAEPWWLVLNKIGKIGLDTKDFMATGLGLLASATSYGMFKDVDKMTKAELAAWRDAKAMWGKGLGLLEGGNWKESPKEWFKKGPWGRLLTDESEAALKAAEEAGENAGKMAKGLKVASYGVDGLGKIFGPLGVIAGGVETGEDVKHHRWAEMFMDADGTVAAAGATFLPPPADVVCGAAGGAILGTKGLYHHVPALHHFMDDVAGNTVQGFERWKHPGTVVRAFAHKGDEIAHEATRKAAHVWHHIL